jgi:hypothetical protein
MFVLILQNFFGEKCLIKNGLIFHPRYIDKVIYFKGTFFQGPTKPLFTSQNSENPHENRPLKKLRENPLENCQLKIFAKIHTKIANSKNFAKIHTKIANSKNFAKIHTEIANASVTAIRKLD